jgi:hypothetical protein
VIPALERAEEQPVKVKIVKRLCGGYGLTDMPGHPVHLLRLKRESQLPVRRKEDLYLQVVTVLADTIMYSQLIEPFFENP